MRKRVSHNLYVGDALEYETFLKKQDGWSFVHACRDPYHRNLLGYKTRFCPKDHPEHLVALRGNRLFLNLLDAELEERIPREIFTAAFLFITQELEKGRRVFVHCNEGRSRAPSLAFLYLFYHGKLSNDYEEAFKEFKQLYSVYAPSKGFRDLCYTMIHERLEDQDANPQRIFA